VKARLSYKKGVLARLFKKCFIRGYGTVMADNQPNNTETSIRTIETTLGELIETLTNIAIESGRTEDEAYYLTSAILNDVIVRE